MAHASDCAVNNEPAMPAGPCDCGDPDCPGVVPRNEDHVTIPTFAYLSMIVTEMRKHADNADEIRALANRVQEVSNASIAKEQ